METDAGPGCVQSDVALLAEFSGWLDRERGLSPVSVRCYAKQSKAFLAGIGGAGGDMPGAAPGRKILWGGICHISGNHTDAGLRHRVAGRRGGIGL